jgi:hypothetical protein
MVEHGNLCALHQPQSAVFDLIFAKDKVKDIIFIPLLCSGALRLNNFEALPTIIFLNSKDSNGLLIFGLTKNPLNLTELIS